MIEMIAAGMMFAAISQAPGGGIGVPPPAGATPVVGDEFNGEQNKITQGTAEVEIIDTRTFPVQIQDVFFGDSHRMRRVKEVLPPHSRPPLPLGLASEEPIGSMLEVGRAFNDTYFPGISATPWTPPDPALAVGPNHVVETVNMDIAWYTKAGVKQFQSRLDNSGNPGFFEGIGAGNFTFDPKCFYDHHSGRFVVLALEVYGSTQAFITFAVSDDSDPNGVWYKYRTNAVVTVGSSTYWVDYPGFGFDKDAFYVTGNLFGLNTGGTAGTLFRVIKKTGVLTGGTASFSDLRDGNVFSVQSAQVFGTSNIAPYFVSVNSTSSLKIHAIKTPLTAPTLVNTTVNVSAFSNPSGGAPNNGGSLDVLDGRIMNAHWRDGKLYAAHGIRASSKNMARWYQLNTNNWPTSGSVTVSQQGNIDGGSGVHTYFPAIYSNKHNDVGVVVARSSSTTFANVCVTGRKASDAANTMGALTQQAIGNVAANGRWGDYFDIAVDPTDDATFWIVGELQKSGGWETWLGSFTITCLADYNGDGFVTGDDFDDFVADFEAGDIAADFNGDGFVTGDDFDAFVPFFTDGSC